MAAEGDRSRDVAALPTPAGQFRAAAETRVPLLMDLLMPTRAYGGMDRQAGLWRPLAYTLLQRLGSGSNDLGWGHEELL